jgi:hypothetical protein
MGKTIRERTCYVKEKAGKVALWLPDITFGAQIKNPPECEFCGGSFDFKR